MTRTIALSFATAALTALVLVLAAPKAEARSYACLDDASYQRSAQRIPATAGRFRAELSSPIWRAYADQAYQQLHPSNSEALPVVPLPVACSAAMTPIAATLSKAYSNEKAALTILAGFPRTSDTSANPTKAQWKALFTKAALTDLYAANVLTALHAQPTRVAALLADRAWIIAAAKAVR